MIEVSIDRADLRDWLVCESSQRWVTAIRRFWPQLMPSHLVPSIINVDSKGALHRLAMLRDQRAIVLWESTRGSLLPVCEQIIQASRACPKSLQLVAATGRPRSEIAILLELPCAAVVRHPEDLPGLSTMIGSYFRYAAG